MNALDRRGFFASTLGLSAALSSQGMAADPKRELAPMPRRFVNRPDNLFLTWEQDPTTTMTIQWVGKEDPTADTTIRYTTGFPNLTMVQKPQVRPFPMPGMKVFRTTLKNLKPDTTYFFEIGRQSATMKFRTMPAKATNSINFVSGGDCGVNSHVIEINKMAARQDPRFAIIGGDLAYDNGISPKTTLEWLKNYSLHMIDTAGFMIPMVVCIGNHEVKGSYGKTRKEAPMYFALFDGLYPETSYATLDFGDYLSLVLMDTGHVSKIAGEQTDWLDKTLADRTDHPHLIVVNHVPCYPSFRPATITAKDGAAVKGGTGEEQRKHWVPLFEKHNVDLVLEHHDHTFKRTHPLKGGLKDKHGILYLGDGSWGKLRSAAKSESRPYIAKASTSYHVTLHRLEDEVRYHMALEEGGKIVDVVHSSKKPRKRG